MMGHKITINNGGVVTTTDTRTLDEAKAERLPWLAAHRRSVEGGGHITTLGIRVDTSDRARILLHGLRTHVQAARDGTTFSFKGADGAWYRLSPEQAVTLCHEVHAFTQACFEHEQKLAAQIMAAQTNEAVDAVDFTQGWPS